MARKQKYTDQFILEVLTARNEQKLTHKELKKKFKLSQNQLSYILYSFKEEYLPFPPDKSVVDSGPITMSVDMFNNKAQKHEASLSLWERIKRWFS